MLVAYFITFGNGIKTMQAQPNSSWVFQWGTGDLETRNLVTFAQMACIWAIWAKATNFWVPRSPVSHWERPNVSVPFRCIYSSNGIKTAYKPKPNSLGIPYISPPQNCSNTTFLKCDLSSILNPSSGQSGPNISNWRQDKPPTCEGHLCSPCNTQQLGQLLFYPTLPQITREKSGI
jgi:hypothetical protein